MNLKMKILTDHCIKNSNHRMKLKFYLRESAFDAKQLLPHVISAWESLTRAVDNNSAHAKI